MPASSLLDEVLPFDRYTGTLVGRVWIGGALCGPRTVVARQDGLFDLSALAPTLSDLFELPKVVQKVKAHRGECVCTLRDVLERGELLAPCDLQAIKAAGVTFADS